MLAYARRLVAECPEEPAMLEEAEQALAAAVSCLRWGRQGWGDVGGREGSEASLNGR